MSCCASARLFNRAADDQTRKKKKTKKALKPPLNTDKYPVSPPILIYGLNYFPN